jgi:hypothetical protein
MRGFTDTDDALRGRRQSSLRVSTCFRLTGLVAQVGFGQDVGEPTLTVGETTRPSSDYNNGSIYLRLRLRNLAKWSPNGSRLRVTTGNLGPQEPWKPTKFSRENVWLRGC